MTSDSDPAPSAPDGARPGPPGGQRDPGTAGPGSGRSGAGSGRSGAGSGRSGAGSGSGSQWGSGRQRGERPESRPDKRRPDKSEQDNSQQSPSEQRRRRRSGSDLPKHPSTIWTPSPKPHTGLGRALARGVIWLALIGGVTGGVLSVFGGTPARPPAAPQPQQHARPPAGRAAAPAPPPAPAGRLLGQLQGSGPRSSAPFALPPSGPVTARYGYRCPAGPGTFRARLMNARGTVSQLIVASSGSQNAGAVRLHPRFPAVAYRVRVRSRCEYRVRVFGP